MDKDKKIKFTYRILIIASLVLIGMIFLPGRTKQKDSEKKLFKAQLIRVVDGDTLLVNFEDREVYVRLIGIDAPESVNPDETKNTPEGIEASKWLKDYLKDINEIQLEFDIERTDKYDRILAYVYVDEKMLNKTILENGYAKKMTIEPNTKYVNVIK